MATSKYKRCLCLGAALLLSGCLSLGTSALTEEAPYYSYRYDHWGSPRRRRAICPKPSSRANPSAAVP